MKKSIAISLIAAAIAAGSSNISAQQTKVLTAEKLNDYGLVYSLPVTALEITVTAEKKTLIAGPYAKYAKKYLATDKIISENAEIWTIKDVYVRPYGAVDTDTKYLMQLKPGATTFIGVDQNGMILSINREPEDLRINAPSYRPSEINPSPQRPNGKEYLQFVDEDFIASQSSAKQAEMLGSAIMEVRDARLSLTRGTADTMPTDGKQLELMLNSLAEQEGAMTAAFTGSEYTEIVSRTYTFVPEEDGESTLFRFSDFKGFCAANDYAGSPFRIRVNVTSEGSLPSDPNGKEKEMPKDAIRYAIPGAAQITLSHDNQTYFNKEMEFAQMGVVFGLNPALFTDKKAPAYAVFSPVTGGILELATLPSQSR